MNFKRFIFVAIATLFSTSLKAQTPPDMVAIADSITNPASSVYYPQLFARYEMGDNSLTLNDYHYLYYGWAQQVNYMPLLDNSARAELEAIMSEQSTPTAEDYKRAIALSVALLKIEPFNPRDLNALAYLYAMTGSEEKSAELMHRLEMIVKTIEATGDGLSSKSPWWITYFDHAEDIIALKGLTMQGKPIILSSSIEFMPIANMAKKKEKGIYFNYSLIYSRDADYLENIKAPKRKMDWTPWDTNNKFRY